MKNLLTRFYQKLCVSFAQFLLRNRAQIAAALIVLGYVLLSTLLIQMVLWLYRGPEYVQVSETLLRLALGCTSLIVGYRMWDRMKADDEQARIDRRAARAAKKLKEMGKIHLN